MRTVRYLRIVAILLAACQPRAPEPLDVVDEPDGGARACVRACATLHRLGCDEGEPTPAGVECSTWLCEARV